MQNCKGIEFECELKKFGTLCGYSKWMPQKRIANLMLGAADYGHTMAKFIILCSPNVIPIANKYLGFGYNGFFFGRKIVD